MLLAALFVGAHNGQRHLTARLGEKELRALFGQAGPAAQQAHEVELAHKFTLLAQTVLHCIQGKSDELELILHVAPAWRELGDDVLKWLVDALGQIQAGCAAQRHEYHGGYDDDEGELVVRRLRHIGHHEHERLASVGGLVEILAVGLAVMRDADNVALFGGVHDDVYVDGVLVGIRA